MTENYLHNRVTIPTRPSENWVNTAAFDTLEYAILLRRLERTFGISGLALTWIQSYLSGRTQFVKIGDVRSDFLAIMAYRRDRSSDRFCSPFMYHQSHV